MDEGGGALASDRPADAAALLREALALWRGPPLADFAYEAFAQPEIARLEEQHVAALEQRIDADLALGRHADLVAELEGLVAEHPLRERLRAQLMVALYRCGRQADALEAYGDARRVLLDELGVEPGPALRELQVAILRQAPALAPAPHAWPRPRAPAPPPNRSAGRRGRPVGRRGRRGGAARRRRVDSACAPRRERRRAIDLAHRVGQHAVDVGPSPSHLAAGGAHLWVTNADGHSVSRVDPDDRAVRQTVAVGNGPAGLAVADGFVVGGQQPRRHGLTDRREHERRSWNASPSGATRPASPPARGGVGGDAGEQTISRIDPRTGESAHVRRDAEPTELAVGAGAVWMTSSRPHRPRRSTPVRDACGSRARWARGPSGIAVTDGAVWVANSLDGTVSRIDPATGAVVRDDPGRQRAARDRRRPWRRVGRRGVRRRTSTASTPTPNRVGERIALGHRPTGLALADGALWVAPGPRAPSIAAGRFACWRHSPFDALDPALAYSPARADRRTDRRRPHRRAARRRPRRHAIVPDLAVTLPRPQDEGRTYRFVLRPGIRYSTGGEVRARDVRPSFERLWKLRPYVFHLPGQTSSTPSSARRSARASPGRATSRAASSPSRATTRWSRSISPARTRTSSTSSRSTSRSSCRRGPRRVRQTSRCPPPARTWWPATTGSPLVLTRNPQFREWSQAARPDGYPDRIEVR